MLRKKKKFLTVSLLYILYTVFPIIPDITGLPVWIVNLMCFVILFALYPRAFANPLVYWFLVYAAILAIYVLVGKPLTIGIGTVRDSKKIFIEYAHFLPSISIFSILYYLKDGKLFKTISLGSLWFLVFSFLYLIPLVLAGKHMLKDAVWSEMLDIGKVIGLPNYSLLHAYVIAVPALLYGLKIFKNRKKWELLTVTALFVWIIINSYITTSLIITFTIIVFVLMFDIQHKTKSFLTFSILAVVITLLNSTGGVVYFLDFLLDFFDGTDVKPKIEGFKYIYLFGDIGGSGAHITGRIDYHEMSWKAFFENFLVGGPSPVGGHSQISDRLGGMGLLAFIPFIMIIVSQVRMVLRLMKNSEQRIYYFLGIASAFILLYQKGLFDQEGWLFLFVLMPGLIISFRTIRRNEYYIKHKYSKALIKNH